MAAPRRTPEFLQRVVDAHRQSSSKAEGARLIGLPYSTFSNALSEAIQLGMLDDGKPASPFAEPIKEQERTFYTFCSEPTLPAPVPESGGPSLPEPFAQSFDPFTINDAGSWGIISDVHIPSHDIKTIQRWADECRQRNVPGILLNGDILDAFYLSRHPKLVRSERFKTEIEKGRQFLEWLRAQFPRARIIFKEGNHDFRLKAYVAEKASELDDLDELTLPALLHLDKLGIEWVADKRVVQLGKLSVIHGHEFRGGGGVNPARWLYLRAGGSTLCGHFHRASEHHEATIDRRQIGVWSVGCACYLYPDYCPINNWQHGYAIVEVASDGHFSVTNRKILRDGSVV